MQIGNSQNKKCKQPTKLRDAHCYSNKNYIASTKRITASGRIINARLNHEVKHWWGTGYLYGTKSSLHILLDSCSGQDLTLQKQDLVIAT